jgi:O-methyltransferase
MRVAKKAYKRARHAVRNARDDLRYGRTYDRHAAYTMIDRNAYIANLRLVENCMRANDLGRGCVVECGTWLGGMSFGLIDVCPQVQEFHCFDSFAGLPEVGPEDGELPRRLQQEGAFVAVNNYADLADFERGLSRFQPSTREKVHVHPGWFENTLVDFKPQRSIDVLRLDCDWYESITLALNTLFDFVSDQGLIIIDDYMTWDGCARAVHDFLSRRQASERIQQAWPGPVSYMIKGLSPMQDFFEKQLSPAAASH